MKTEPTFQEKHDELHLQMAMLLLEQHELEEAEKEISGLNEHPESAPNFLNEEQLSDLINQTLKRQKRKNSRKKVSRIVQQAAVFFLILLIGLCTTVISVEAVQRPFIEWLMSVEKDSTAIHFQKETNMSDIEFGYLPDGYTAEIVFQEGTSCHYLIENGNGASALLMIGSLDTGISIDTDDAKITDFSINGYKAIGAQKEGENILAWASDSKSFVMSGNLPLEVMIEIAKFLQA